MLLETKKKILQYRILEAKYDYDMIIFRIIDGSSLDTIIDKIDEVSLMYDIPLNDNENKIDAKQFLCLLNYFIETFKRIFTNLQDLQLTIMTILTENTDLVEKYFLIKEKPYDSEVNDVITDCLYKIIIQSFIANSKYIPMIIDLLEKNNLKVKEIDDYTLEESKEIIYLLSSLTFCKCGSGVLILFENMNQKIEKRLKRIRVGKNREKNSDFQKQKIVAHFLYWYRVIIDGYYKKQKYIKLFKK